MINRVIAVALLGQKLSSKPNEGFLIKQLANDFHDFLEAKDLENLALARLALGGLMILKYLKTF